ncbi:YciI family protein [Paenibacillus radicis (ex Xue et al. 2023)]|uniref:YciI family protein n=1 Tax=Paenibacillus radicis (ex Xue et al. 2023) TaxID=2972489 RepID=A0ABT1YMP8_9BACL|nr:YciI family protein [Paenibacillus radicis (ex Xue et al. 2023)]MCR8634010.1 YciI family protein [Paenibacillus radicis (ex Xue et al. 2023)]
MKYYAVFLPIINIEKSQQFRPQHLEFLEKGRNEGKIFASGKFSDGSGGLVIYIAESTDEVVEAVRQDPYVSSGARGYEIHEWEIVTKAVIPQ